MKLILLIPKKTDRTWEVFYQGDSVIVDAPNEMSAKYRAATLIKLVGFKVNPYMITAWEISEEAA